MRRMLVSVVVAVAVLSAAGVVERQLSFGMPVLTVNVRTGGGYSRLPFAFERTDANAPLKIMVADDTPSGSGASIRSSVWLAAVTAAMQRNDPMSGVRITVEFSGNIDGPSAGGVICLSILSALDGRKVPEDFAMTGTIMPDGTIGVVGGVAKKLSAAIDRGCKRICIPAFIRFERQEDGSLVDLFRIGEDRGVRIRPVHSIGEAYAFAHGVQAQAESSDDVDVCSLPRVAEDLLLRHCKESERAIGKIREGIPESMSKSLREDDAFFSQLLFKKDYARKYISGKVMSAASDVTSLHMAWTVVPLWVSRVSELMSKYPILGEKPPFGATTRSAYEVALDGMRRGFDVSSKKIFSAVVPQTKADGGNCIGYCRESEQISEIAAQSETACSDASDAAGMLFYLQAITPDKDDFRNMDDAALSNVLELEMRKEFFRILCEQVLAGKDCRVSLTEFYRTCSSVRPNASLERAENLFHSAGAAVDASIIADIVKREASQASVRDDSVENALARKDARFACYYFAKSRGNRTHAWLEKPEELVDPKYHTVAMLCRNAQILSMACAILVKYGADINGSYTDDGDYVCGNPDFLNHLVRRARRSALVSIDECSRAGIPCIAAKVLFECAEGVDVTKLDAADAIGSVLQNYWEAGLTAKALLMGFLHHPAE